MVQRIGGIGNQGAVRDGQNSVIPGIVIIQTVFEVRFTPLCNGLRYVNNGIIFPSQSKAKKMDSKKS